jgi:2-oxoglutarate ferredoxin oxidoreductase subunit gamma
MEQRMIFAGAGGQGLMMLGKLVAYAAMNEGRSVTWFPSYGAEVRGGTAHCHIVISDTEVYSPIVEKATALLIMNEPSLKRFLPRLAADGLVVLNTSLAQPPVGANGSFLAVPATDIANELGNIRVANMAMLGALNARAKLVSEEAFASAVRESLGESKKALLGVNLDAYRRGFQIGAR